MSNHNSSIGGDAPCLCTPPNARIWCLYRMVSSLWVHSLSSSYAYRTYRTCRTYCTYRTVSQISFVSLFDANQGSHRPSFHPVRHRSSHLVQSNVSLPSFSLTALCASHIHVPNSLRLDTLGVFLLIQLWKSSAQTQHGYSLPNVERKDLVSVCSCGDGCVGYVAVMECSSVHELRPRASTSGGQSDGSAGVMAAAAEGGSEGFAAFLGLLPVMANQEATSVHVRHLHNHVSFCVQV
jgi:hypothetical protein